MKINKVKNFAIFIACIIYLISYLNLAFGMNFFGIKTETYHIGSIFIASIILWLFVSIEWPSLLAILSIGIMPSIGFSKVTQLSFGNTTFVFLIFTFIVTYALNKTNFLRIFTNRLLSSKLAQKSVLSFLFMYLFTILIITSIMSPTVVFMFIFPLYEEIVKEFKWKKGEKSPSILLFLTFSTISIGTAMTPINHVFSITALSILKTSLQISISNLEYMIIGIPIALIIFFISTIGLLKLDLKSIDIKNLSKSNDDKLNKSEVKTVIVFFVMILLWIVPDIFAIFSSKIFNELKSYGLVFPPLLATIILLTIGNKENKLLNLSDAFKNGIYWQSLILVSATLSIGSVISNPEIGMIDLIKYIFSSSFNNLHHLLIILLFIIFTAIMTNFTSNLVTVSFVTTLLISLKPLGINISLLTIIIGFMSSLAVMSAPSMPYVALSIGSGWINSKDCMKYGLIFIVISIFISFIGINIAEIYF